MSFRYWLIKKLAGTKHQVCINMRISHGTLDMNNDHILMFRNDVSFCDLVFENEKVAAAFRRQLDDPARHNTTTHAGEPWKFVSALPPEEM
jgi:hypothetical protein